MLITTRAGLTRQLQNVVALFHFSSLIFEVAINAIPTIPVIIIADTGRVPKNINIAPVKAKMIPVIN